jgi:hypothetical protein
MNPDQGFAEWSAGSEGVHGISLSDLMQHGLPAEHVAARAVQVLASPGTVVCSDAPEFDAHWLARLLEAGGLGQRLPLLDVRQAYGMACRPLLTLVPTGEGRERQFASCPGGELIPAAPTSPGTSESSGPDHFGRSVGAFRRSPGGSRRAPSAMPSVAPRWQQSLIFTFFPPRPDSVGSILNVKMCL